MAWHGEGWAGGACRCRCRCTDLVKVSNLLLYVAAAAAAAAARPLCKASSLMTDSFYVLVATRFRVNVPSFPSAALQAPPRPATPRHAPPPPHRSVRPGRDRWAPAPSGIGARCGVIVERAHRIGS